MHCAALSAFAALCKVMGILQAVTEVIQAPIWAPAAWGFAASFAVCVLLVLSKSWHGDLTMDSALGVQKFHTTPTPRVGGIPILLGATVAWANAPLEVQKMLVPILVAGMPAFIIGLAEDLTKRVSVAQRLLATIASGILAWWLTDYCLSRVDIVGVDWLLKFKVIAVLFTAFAVGGVANSINIIDGFNGLASTMSALAFIGFGLIAWQVGDRELTSVSLILAACVWGFFWVNWPFGKIFLGDGGSYFVGFLLAWVAVMLVERNQSVSAFAALLICVHPITEVLFSIFRRRVKKLNAGHPDRLHFHSLFKQRYVRRWFSSYSRTLRNSITGALMGLMTLTAVVLANAVHDSLLGAFLGFMALALAYVAIYARMVCFRWRSPIGFLFTKPLFPAL